LSRRHRNLVFCPRVERRGHQIDMGGKKFHAMLECLWSFHVTCGKHGKTARATSQ
jgi:hypothetical protein